MPSGSANPERPAQPAKPGEQLEAMVEVLRSVASVRAPDRALAVRYTETRTALLNSRLKTFLPPYLAQCVSVFKFHDFINLFAPDAARRVEFIDQSFQASRKSVGFGRQYDVFADGD